MILALLVLAVTYLVAYAAMGWVDQRMGPRAINALIFTCLIAIAVIVFWALVA